jgi:hypothetical protein
MNAVPDLPEQHAQGLILFVELIRAVIKKETL